MSTNDWNSGDIRDEMEWIYGRMPAAEIPWNIESPPEPLVELVNSGLIRPSNAIDLGCGAGNYAVYLAAQGFNVTGVDISPAAIAMARENAEKRGAKCEFLVADVVAGLDKFSEMFDLAYDWSLLHHVFPEQREQYIDTVYRLLVPGGQYLSVCFNEHDTVFPGTGRYRQTPIGTTLYFSSIEELTSLFSRRFTVKSLKTIELPGKSQPHVMNYALMEKPR